jgi:hypothetical protein
VMSLSRTGHCPQALSRLFRMGNEDTSLAFTLYGFEHWMKSAHFQYYAGAIEAACQDEKNARKRWAKGAKMSETLPSPEFAFPILAAWKLNPDDAKPKIAAALASVRAALSKSGPESKPALVCAEGMLLRASGQEEQAATRLEEAFQSGTGIVRYLALTELTQMFGTSK